MVQNCNGGSDVNSHYAHRHTHTHTHTHTHVCLCVCACVCVSQFCLLKGPPQYRGHSWPSDLGFQTQFTTERDSCLLASAQSESRERTR